MSNPTRKFRRQLFNAYWKHKRKQNKRELNAIRANKSANTTNRDAAEFTKSIIAASIPAQAQQFSFHP